MKFRGKNGFVMWFTLVLVVTLGAGMLILLGSAGNSVAFGAMLVVFALITIIIAWIMIRNCIYVENGEIKVCLGMTTSVVAISSIISMKKVVNAVASSGTSLDRIEIAFMKDNKRNLIYVSPKDKDGFIKAVRDFKPEIKIY